MHCSSRKWVFPRKTDFRFVLVSSDVSLRSWDARTPGGFSAFVGCTKNTGKSFLLQAGLYENVELSSLFSDVGEDNLFDEVLDYYLEVVGAKKCQRGRNTGRDYRLARRQLQCSRQSVRRRWKQIDVVVVSQISFSYPAP